MWINERNDAIECEEETAKEFQTTNTDLQILIWRWMFDNENETFEAVYYGDTLFWLFHDFNHAQKDVTGLEIYVNEDIEEARIFDALVELQNIEMLHEFRFEMLNDIHKEFLNRWNHRIDRERIIEICGFQEEEEYFYDEEISEY